MRGKPVNINVKRAVIICGVAKWSPDLVRLHTDLPSPFPNVSKSNLVLNFEVATGTGPDYVKTAFPDVKDIEVIG